MTDKQQEKLDRLEARYLQVGLAGITDHALETGDKAAYETKEYHQAKQRFLSLRIGHKQKAATNYFGGGPDGGNDNGNK